MRHRRDGYKELYDGGVSPSPIVDRVVHVFAASSPFESLSAPTIFTRQLVAAWWDGWKNDFMRCRMLWSSNADRKSFD